MQQNPEALDSGVNEGAAPARERLTASDAKLAAVAVLVAALSAFYVLVNYRAAFPQASLRLELSRDQATSKALDVLRAQGLQPGAGFRNLTLFDPDDGARLFLEREAGLDRANELMQGAVPVWKWRARWYKPPGKEEFLVWLSPAGRLLGFDHVVPEDAPGARRPVEEARSAAEQFLRGRTTRPFRIVEEQSEDKPNRRDHQFTFEYTDFRLHDATVRAAVEVRGGAVASFREFLRVPEQWQRDFAALRSKNQLYTMIAQVFYVLLMLAAAVLLVVFLRRGAIAWAGLMVPAAVVGALNMLSEANNVPFYLDALPTSTPPAEALPMLALQAVGSGIGTLLLLLLLAGPGSVLYGGLLPGRLSLGAALRPPAWRTREFFRACCAGLAFAGAHLAFITAFYLVGQRLGVWSPQDVNQSDLLSTWAPWIYPFAVSMLASSSEEFAFRLLAVPLVKRWTGSTAAAVIVPAFVWGFLHANYPQQPGYIRGVEVGLIGMAAGWFMLRFGIVATLVWHYTVDAILFSTYLFAAGQAVLQASGVIVSAAAVGPLAWCLWRYRRDGGFAPAAAWSNAGMPASAAPHVEEHGVEQPESPAAPPAWHPRLLYLAAAVAGVLGALVTTSTPGDFVRIPVTLAEARQAAGPPPAAWSESVEYAANIDDDSYEYLRRHVGREEANRILAERTTTGVWRVRQFQPGSKTERYRYVNADGRWFREDLVLDEKAPGANLSQDEARALAETYLRTRQGVDVSRYRLVDSSSEKREHRTDHSFVWEDTAFRAAEAQARLSLEVLGDQPSQFRRFLKIPEQWLREYQRPRIQSYLVPAVIGGFGFLLILVFLRNARHVPLRWRRAAGPALAVALCVLVAEWNEAPGFYAHYSTAQPVGDFTSDALLGLGIRLLLFAFAAGMGAFLLDAYLYLTNGNRARPPLAIPQAVAAAILGVGVLRALGAMERLVPGDRWAIPVWTPPNVAVEWPWLAVITSAGLAAAAGAIALGLAVTALPALYGGWRRAGFIATVAVCFGIARSGSAALFLFHTAAALVMIAVVWLLVRTTGPAVSTWMLAIFLAAAARGALALASQPDAWFQRQGMAAGSVAVGAAAVAYWRLLRPAEAGPVSSAVPPAGS